jgi:hypothetical protein
MAVITTVGSAGAGAMWGWVIGLREGNLQRPFRTFAILIFATALVVAEVGMLAGKEQLATFSVTALISLFLHMGWRRYLRLHTHQC